MTVTAARVANRPPDQARINARHAAGRTARGGKREVPWHLWGLAGFAFVCFLVMAPHGGRSWHFFADGGELLVKGAQSGPAGGLHLYANYPQLQIGPVAVFLSALLRPFGPHDGEYVAQFLMAMLGPALVALVERVALTVRPGRRRATPRWVTLVAGGAFIVSWSVLAVHYSHLDDALALAFAILAVRAAIEGRPAVAGLYLGLATDAKPWALVFLPLAVAGPRPTRWPALVMAVSAILVAWMPFVLCDPGTLTATQFTIPNTPGSALRVLGVSNAQTPSWDRAAQLIGGWALALIAVRRGRWPAVILLGVGVRIALDPGTYGYYTAGLMAGALVWDLVGAVRPRPVWTLACLAALSVPPLLTNQGTVLGVFRLGIVAAFVIGLLVPRRRGTMPLPAGPWRAMLRSVRLPVKPRRWLFPATPARAVRDERRARRPRGRRRAAAGVADTGR
jgi:hypothetical protein